jgi:hypothetical protein
MKKLLTTLSIAAALSICTLTQVQSQDTTLAKIDNTKKTDNLPKETKTQSSINEDATADQVNVEPHSKFILPEVNEKNSKGSLNNKVGPQGEEIFIENRKFYYINSEGQKVTVKSTELRNKPKHS